MLEGADNNCNDNTPSYIQLRTRSIEKPINPKELFEIAYKKQTEWSEKQKEREKYGLDAEHDTNLEYILLKDVSRKSFMDWIKESHHGLRPSFVPTSRDLSKGNILITEIPSAAHEVAAGELMMAFDYALMEISRNLEDSILHIPGKDILWTNGRVKIPDGGLNTLDSQYPNLVIEIAYSEPMQQLRNEVHGWIQFTSHVRISIGLKIFTRNTQGQRKMTLLYEDRQGWTQEIEFGVAAAPQLLRIPVAVLYQDNIPSELQGIEFLEIPLAPLRKKILRQL